MTTVHDLRKKGFKVKVRHNRLFYYDLTKNLPVLCTHGGWTDVEVIDPTTNRIYAGQAECSKKDHYCRKLGVRIALGRALKKMYFPM